MIRTRYTHRADRFVTIGDIRSVFFSWLHARKNNGHFYLRMDDATKSNDARKIYDHSIADFTWLGVNWDLPDDNVVQGMPGHMKPCSRSVSMRQETYEKEWKTVPGVMHRSLRGYAYMEALSFLKQNGFVYDCFLTPEEAKTSNHRDLTNQQKCEYWKAGRHQRIRLNLGVVSKRIQHVAFADQVMAGCMRADPLRVEDCILMESDGSFTDLFTQVVDDVALGITHVVRAQMHLKITIRQILLYAAMDKPIPTFAHLGLSNLPSLSLIHI